jgi:hypothetical protein
VFNFQSAKQARLNSTHQGRCVAHIFVLRVGEELEAWPEHPQRQRRWVRAATNGARVVREPADRPSASPPFSPCNRAGHKQARPTLHFYRRPRRCRCQRRQLAAATSGCGTPSRCGRAPRAGRCRMPPPAQRPLRLMKWCDAAPGAAACWLPSCSGTRSSPSPRESHSLALDKPVLGALACSTACGWPARRRAGGPPGTAQQLPDSIDLRLSPARAISWRRPLAFDSRFLGQSDRARRARTGNTHSVRRPKPYHGPQVWI